MIFYIHRCDRTQRGSFSEVCRLWISLLEFLPVRSLASYYRQKTFPFGLHIRKFYVRFWRMYSYVHDVQ